MRLRPVSVALSLLLLLVLAYAAWWSSAVWQLRRTVEEYAAEVRAAGGEVSYEALAAGGFPLNLEMAASELTVREADGTVWTAGRAGLWARAWNPLEPRLTVTDGFTFTAAPGMDARDRTSITAADLVADLRFTTAGELAGFQAAASNLVLPAASEGPPVRAERLTAAYAAPDAPEAAQDAAGHLVSLTLHRTALPLPANGPAAQSLGTVVDQISLNAALTGPAPSDLTAAELRRWIDGGGLLQVPSLRLVWGGLDVVGDATLALDTTLQPEGAGTLSVAGGEKVVEAAASAGLLDRAQADQVRPLLTLMAQPDADGVKRITLPLTLQNRRLTLGPLPVAELPPIDWPGGE